MDAIVGCVDGGMKNYDGGMKNYVSFEVCSFNNIEITNQWLSDSIKEKSEARLWETS